MCERSYIRYTLLNIKDEDVQESFWEHPRYWSNQSPQSQEIPHRAAKQHIFNWFLFACW